MGADDSRFASGRLCRAGGDFRATVGPARSHMCARSRLGVGAAECRDCHAIRGCLGCRANGSSGSAGDKVDGVCSSARFCRGTGVAHRFLGARSYVARGFVHVERRQTGTNPSVASLTCGRRQQFKAAVRIETIPPPPPDNRIAEESNEPEAERINILDRRQQPVDPGVQNAR